MRKTIAFATALAVMELSLSGCYGDRPGRASDHHRGGHHGHDRDHRDGNHWR